MKRMAESLAATPLRNLWISIDSAVPEVHEKMRGFPGVIRGIEKALPIFHQFGIYPSANLGINRNMGGESPYPCLGGKDFFFIDARDGNTYPCGYRGHENFGKLCDPQFGPPENPAPCRRCDWECFRDPSELFGPLLQARSDPLSLASEIRRDPLFYRLWIDDLRYYRACDWFDGRKAPSFRKLRIFGNQNQEVSLTPTPVPAPLWEGGRKQEGI